MNKNKGIISLCLKETWNVISRNFLPIFLMFILFTGLSMLINFIMQRVFYINLGGFSQIHGIISWVLTSIPIYIFWSGLISMSEIKKYERVNFFAGAELLVRFGINKFWPVLWTAVTKSFIIFIMYKIIGFIGDGLAMFVFNNLTSLIVDIIIAILLILFPIRYFFYYMLSTIVSTLTYNRSINALNYSKSIVKKNSLQIILILIFIFIFNIFVNFLFVYFLTSLRFMFLNFMNSIFYLNSNDFTIMIFLNSFLFIFYVIFFTKYFLNVENVY